MVEMCDFIPCRKYFLQMASSPQAEAELATSRSRVGSPQHNTESL